MSDINTARSSFDHAGFENFMNASSDSPSEPSSPRKKPRRRQAAAASGSAASSRGRKAPARLLEDDDEEDDESTPWWDKGGGGIGDSSAGSSEVAQLGTGKNFLRRTRDPPSQGRGAALDDTLQQSGLASIAAEQQPQQRQQQSAGVASYEDFNDDDDDDNELRLQLTRSSQQIYEEDPAADAADTAAAAASSDVDETDGGIGVGGGGGGLAVGRGKPSMLSKVSLLESLDSSSQQQQPTLQQQHNGDTLHSQTDLSAVRDAYRRKLDTLEESTDQRHTGFLSSGLNSLPSEQLPAPPPHHPQQQQQQQQQLLAPSGNTAATATIGPSLATQSFGLQVLRQQNTEQKEMSIDDLLAEHNEVMTERRDLPRRQSQTPSPPPSPPPPPPQPPQPAQRRQQRPQFDETRIVVSPNIVRPSTEKQPARQQKKQQQAKQQKLSKPLKQQQQQQQPQLKFGHVKSSGYGRGRGGGGDGGSVGGVSSKTFVSQRPQSLPPQSQQKQQQQQQQQQQQPSVDVDASSTQQQRSQLREEVQEWRDLLRAERSHRLKLESDLHLAGLERAKEADATRRRHEQEVQQLRQEMCALEARLEADSQQQQQQTVWRSLKQRPLGPEVTREEVDGLASQLKEQEELMSGYQRENERLYAELKTARASGKGVVDALSGQKLQLEQELREARDQLARQEVQLRSRPQQTPQLGAASAGPIASAGQLLAQQDRCGQLEAELRASRRRLEESRAELASCQRELVELRQQVDRLVKDKLAADDQLLAARSVRGVELDKLKDQYEAELDRLQRKVKWFAENQRLVDKDQARLREQEATIGELRHRLDAAEHWRRRRHQRGHDDDDDKEVVEGAAAATARVRDLERQVRELETILAASRRRTGDVVVGGSGTAAADATRDHLERRVRELEAQLAQRETAEGRSLRALRQRYEAAKEDYESRIQVLEADLKRFKDAHGRPHGSLTSLQRELEALRVRHKEKMLEKDREIERVRAEATSEAAQTLNERRAVARAEALQRELREKQAELDRVKRDKAGEKEKERQSYSAKLSQAVQKHQRETDGLRQQLVAMETSLASARAELATERGLALEARRRADARVGELQDAQVRELDRLVGEHAKTFAESRVAQLQARLDSQEAIIDHLKAAAAAAGGGSSTAADEASRLRRREQSLTAEVAELRAALADERAAHTPQMRQFVALRDRIRQLETRHTEREREVERLVRDTRAAARSDAQAEVARWRQAAETKSRQIEQFRTELDLILEVLRELQRQGVSLPVPPALRDTLSGL